MRRRITLYIDGAQADINDQSLILFNYSYTDNEKPTAVKNSYSQQITLPATPANDAIFGHYYRPDRITAGGFNALVKTPFILYDGTTGDIIESGYARLDAVTRTGRRVTAYKVSLFGGLGGFLYALSYGSDGSKRTLASLKYLAAGDFDTELDFVINRQTVQGLAWGGSGYLYDTGDKFNVFNFAPCYEGAPDGGFDADKGIIDCSDMGIEDDITEGGVNYSIPSGYKTIAKLFGKVTEWQAKDLRSYLQRPVLNAKYFMKGISRSAYNGGYEVDWSDVEDDLDKLWITLPLLTSIGEAKQSTANYNLTSVATPVGSRLAGRWNAPSSAVIGALSDCEITATISFDYATQNYEDLYIGPWTGVGGYKEEVRNVWFIQFVALSAGGTIVGGSKVFVRVEPTSNPDAQETLEGLANLLGYDPDYAGVAYEQVSLSGTIFFGPLSATFRAQGATRVECRMSCFAMLSRYIQGNNNMNTIAKPNNGRLPWYLKYLGGDSWDAESPYAYHPYYPETATMVVTTPTEVRSGAYITKADFLNTKNTPAEYLLSLAKTFGWVFVCDRTAKRVTILSRDTYFDTGLPAIDLTQRVNRGKEMTITPMQVTTKWYEYALKQGGGAFYEEYLAKFGQPYGIARVNTGYDFDADPINLQDGNIFREAVSLLEYSKYFNRITDGGAYKPSLFVEAGNTYTLWNAEGSAKQFPIPSPSAEAQIEYYNPDYIGYDLAGGEKVQLRAADGKALDGDCVLLWFNGFKSYPREFKVSDDTSEMLIYNDGKPCWDLTRNNIRLSLPSLSRLRRNVAGNIEKVLEFGDVREIGTPAGTLLPNSSVYSRYWKAWLSDRLNADTKVLRCRVNLRGLPAPQDLLRRFFYYDGAYWVLNGISNYSLTTWDDTECELIQVRNTSNYRNGQIR